MATRSKTPRKVAKQAVFKDVSDALPQLPFWAKQVLAGPHENFHYLIGDPNTKRAVVIDPAFELGPLWALAKADGYTIVRSMFTHGHWDHIGGAEESVRRGVKELMIHERGATHPKLKIAASMGATLEPLQDGRKVNLDSIGIDAMWTPGHQPESMCFLVGPAGGPRLLFGGDTLFVGSCGRTDFADGDTEAMFHSMARLRNLAAAGEIHVMPGHNYHMQAHRTLADEAAANPALATTDFDTFSALPFLSG